jgi:uncharacterized membrane protein YfhO
MAEKKTENAEAKPASFNLLNFIDKFPQLVLFVLMGLISFIVFKDFIFFKKIYLFKDIGSDSINLYVPWINCFADYMKTEGTPAWSFEQGMGQNIFPLWLGDFLSNILMYMDKENIPYALAYVEIVKILISGFVFYKFLRELKLSNYVSILFALMYAFSGFVVMGGAWVIYSIEAMNVAVILYGFERWLNHKKYLWFVIGITLLTFLQPSLLFPWTIFLAPYITVRYFEVNEKGIKEFIGFTFKTVLLAALGVMLAGYQLLPDILQVAESPRVSGESGLFDKLRNQSAFSFADTWQRFTAVFRSFGTDMIGNGNNFKGWYNYLEAPLFYCGVLCLVLFPQFFVSLNKKQKRFYGVLTFLFCLPLFFPYFRYAFWAFSGDYYRTFSLVIVLLLLIYSARALDFIAKQHKINKIALGVTVLLLLFLLYSPAAQFKGSVNETMRTVVTMLVLGYAFFIFREGDPKSKSSLRAIFLIVCVFELTYMSWSTVNNRDTLRRVQLTERVGYNDYTVDAVKYLKNVDKSFYRINKDYSSGLAMHGSINDAKAVGFYSTPSYHSFNQKNYIRFLGEFGVIDASQEFATRWAKGLTDRPILFSLAAGKYWLSKRTDKSIEMMGYDSIAKFGDVKVLRNRYSAPMGITYSQIMPLADLKKMSNIQKDFSVIRACVVDSSDIQDFSKFKRFNLADTNIALNYNMLDQSIKALKADSLHITDFHQNHIAGDINLKEDKILFFSFPYDEGWKAKVNNADAKLYRIDAGLTGLILSKGNNQVELNFKPRLKKEGGLLSLASLLILGGLGAFGFIRKKKVV